MAIYKQMMAVMKSAKLKRDMFALGALIRLLIFVTNSQ